VLPPIAPTRILEVVTSVAPWRAAEDQWRLTLRMAREQWEECIDSEPVNQLRREECVRRSDALGALLPFVLAPPLVAALLLLGLLLRARRFWGHAAAQVEGREFEGSWRIETVRPHRPFRWFVRDSRAWLLGLKPYQVTIGRRPSGVMYVAAGQGAPRVGETWSLFKGDVRGRRRLYLGVRRDPEAELEQVRRRKAVARPAAS
jgi:hypothetical protein